MVVPALASVFCRIGQTVGVAAWTAAVVCATKIASDSSYSSMVLGVGFTLLACSLGVAACAARLGHAAKMARLRSAAVALQCQILRPLPVLTDHVLAHGLYEPIEEDRFVGGDVYEMVESPYGTRVVIGDVQGKGIAAIGTGFAALGAFREAAYREPTLTGVVEAMEAAVVRHNGFAAQTGDAERFVTALVLSLDGGDRVEVLNCGHLYPRILDGGTARRAPLGDASVPLGLGELVAEPRAAERFDLPPGATLLLCTDGVTEARDENGAFYPFDARLERWAGLEPDEVLEALRADLRSFTGGVRRDDVAALALRPAPAADRNGDRTPTFTPAAGSGPPAHPERIPLPSRQRPAGAAHPVPVRLGTPLVHPRTGLPRP